MTMQMYFESCKYICFLGARSLRSLAQYKYIYFLSVHFGVLPPQYQKDGYATASHNKHITDGPHAGPNRTSLSSLIVSIFFSVLLCVYIVGRKLLKRRKGRRYGYGSKMHPISISRPGEIGNPYQRHRLESSSTNCDFPVANFIPGTTVSDGRGVIYRTSGSILSFPSGHTNTNASSDLGYLEVREQSGCDVYQALHGGPRAPPRDLSLTEDGAQKEDNGIRGGMNPSIIIYETPRNIALENSRESLDYEDPLYEASVFRCDRRNSTMNDSVEKESQYMDMSCQNCQNSKIYKCILNKYFFNEDQRCCFNMVSKVIIGV